MRLPRPPASTRPRPLTCWAGTPAWPSSRPRCVGPSISSANGRSRGHSLRRNLKSPPPAAAPRTPTARQYQVPVAGGPDPGTRRARTRKRSAPEVGGDPRTQRDPLEVRRTRDLKVRAGKGAGLRAVGGAGPRPEAGGAGPRESVGVAKGVRRGADAELALVWCVCVGRLPSASQQRPGQAGGCGPWTPPPATLGRKVSREPGSPSQRTPTALARHQRCLGSGVRQRSGLTNQVGETPPQTFSKVFSVASRVYNPRCFPPTPLLYLLLRSSPPPPPPSLVLVVSSFSFPLYLPSSSPSSSSPPLPLLLFLLLLSFCDQYPQ